MRPMLTGTAFRVCDALRQSCGMAADTSWTLDPGPVLLIGTLAGVYVARWRQVRRAHPGFAGRREAPTWALVCYLGGILALIGALISPVDRLAEQAFTMHMVQHVLLLDLAPIGLILGLTKVILRPVTHRLQRLEESAGVLAHPIFAVFLYVALMWLWHVPAMYDAALAHPLLHIVEHVCFLSAGLLYWWHLLGPIRGRHRLTEMGAVVYMLSTKLLVGLLGIGLTFAPEPLYAFYQHQAPIWGLTPTEDESLAGGLMAFEQSVVMGIALVWLFVNALTASDAAERRAERYAARGG
jgi:putative membrane protein